MPYQGNKQFQLVNSKIMNKDLEKNELHIARLKSALNMLERMKEMIPEEVYETQLNDYLDELSKALKKRELLK